MLCPQPLLQLPQCWQKHDARHLPHRTSAGTARNASFGILCIVVVGCPAEGSAHHFAQAGKTLAEALKQK